MCKQSVTSVLGLRGCGEKTCEWIIATGRQLRRDRECLDGYLKREEYSM